MSTIKINTCDREWFGRDYVFYDSQGNPINVLYDSENEIYEGKLYFEENSSDTFKTIELTLFERIRGFEYQQYTVTGGSPSATQSADELFTEKFQLFNTDTIKFINNTNINKPITKIEAVNDREDFYSKWIYGEQFDLIYPPGTEVKPNVSIFGLDPNNSYTVVTSKQNAILIITPMDNKTFVNTFGDTVNNSENYSDVTLNGFSGLKILNYVDKNFDNQFPDWSEPDFYNQTFNGQKISIINSDNNDGIVSVKNETLGDNYYHDYKLLVDDLDGDLTIRIINKTSNFKVFSGGLTFNATASVLEFSSIPSTLLLPGVGFTIPLSVNNNKTLTVDSIPTFNPVNTFYTDGSGTVSNASQVVYENAIYHCITSYTQSATSSITPLNTTYWVRSSFLPILEKIKPETLLNVNVFLTNNIVNLPYNYDTSVDNRTNLAKAFEEHRNNLDLLGAEAFLDSLNDYGIVKSKFPTKYIEVEFYIDKLDTFSGSITDGSNFATTSYAFTYDPHPESSITVKVNDSLIEISEDRNDSTAFGYFSNDGGVTSLEFDDLSTSSNFFWKEINANFGLTATDVVTFEYTTEVSTEERIIERVLELEENVVSEVNKNYSEQQERRIIVTDIDEFGLKITINTQEYEIDSTLIFQNNGDLDIEASVDATLKEWVTRWRLELDRRGIKVFSEYFGNDNLTLLHNSISLVSYYPNVSIEVEVQVGTTADFHFMDQTLIVYQMGLTGSQLNLTVNNRLYIEPFDTNINTTLSNWVTTHSGVLLDFGIIVESINQIINFKKKDGTLLIDVSVNLGTNFLPGEKDYQIIKYWRGNEGLILTSNNIRQFNSSINFEEECFSTGHIISINNSPWTLNNQEYNIIYLDPDKMTLSYQGPFFGTINSNNQNAFFSLAFGDKLNLGDYVIGLFNGNSVTGTITKISNTYYQILTDSNQVLTIDRNNAFGFDSNANNLTISPDQEVVIKYLNVSPGIVDIDYFNTSERISVVGTQSEFIRASDVRKTEIVDFTGTASKQVVNPINNYLFILVDDKVVVLDPVTEQLVTEISLLATGWDITVDSDEGNVYVSLVGNDRIQVILPDLSFESTDYFAGLSQSNLAYNRQEKFIYVSHADPVNEIYRINGDDRTEDLGYLVDGFTGLGIGDFRGGTFSNQFGTLHYNSINGSIYVSISNSLYRLEGTTLTDLNVPTDGYYSIAFDSYNNYIWVSNIDNNLYAIDNNNDLVGTYGVSTYGNIIINEADSNLYLSTQDGSNQLLVFSTLVNQTFFTIDLAFELYKTIYNPIRESIVGFGLTVSQIADVKVNFIYSDYKSLSTAFNQSSEKESVASTGGTTDQGLLPEFLTTENIYGTLVEDFSESPYLSLKTREFLRRPRQNYMTTGATQAQWVYHWETDEVDEIFMVDISGNFLPTTGSYAYTGVKPLENPILRNTPNRNVQLIGQDYAQQTIFDRLTYSLDYNDSEENLSFVPEGLQVILGFNSNLEGVISNKLMVTQHEEIEITYPSFASFDVSTLSVTLPKQIITLTHSETTGYGQIFFNDSSTDLFTSKIDLTNLTSSQTNFDVGHILNIRITDNTNDDNYLSPNDNITVQIVEIYARELVVKYLDDITFVGETTEISDFPSVGTTTYLDFKLTVQPKSVVEIDIFGQTEVEDPRYTTELTNTGKTINPEEIYIFKDYDINEGGIDWKFMNHKRKELLTVRNDIYNYIGAYRSLINAINYFGYNDLELYEYFRNINEDSEEYLKLLKVEVIDIFDNTVEGWTEDGYKAGMFPNENYEETKLFNLTYRLTDFEGNKLTTYSLQEVVIKLMGLKNWLEKNIVPLTHKILDITGRSDFLNLEQIFHLPSSVQNININDNHNPVDFNLDETYVMPINSGSTVYNSVLSFTYGSTSSIPDYFDIRLRTYRIYDEWDPFVSYNHGDKVRYFGKIYENVLIDATAEALGQDPTNVKNTNNNPREFENIEEWSSSTIYNEGDIVMYEREIYKFSLNTSTVNYLPWSTATGSCIVGTPSQTNNIDDNFYTDLVDRIGNEPTIPSYWIMDSSKVNINFDILDLFRTNYPLLWCELIDRTQSVIDNLAVDMLNLPEANYNGTKPSNITEANSLINDFIDDYLATKDQYKFKFRHDDPVTNLLLLPDFPDFVLWDKITIWLEIDLEPVQILNEYRSGEDMFLPYNFTLDTNIDPYVVIQVTSDNGYGQIINNKKSYEIRFDADSDSVLIKTLR